MGSRLLSGQRRDREHASARAPLEVGQAQLHDADRRQEHQLDRVLQRLRRNLRARPRRRTGRVPDEDVEAAERLQRGRDRPLEVVRKRDVAADRERPDPVGLPLEHIPPPREHRDVCALARERLGGGQAEA